MKRLRWDIIGPVGLVVAAVLAVAWLDVSKGGDAQPKAPLGTIGSPVPRTYVPPTPTPFGYAPTPKPRPTVAGAATAAGNPAVRDEKRRGDLLLLLSAAATVKSQDGSYPSTNNNVQSLCNYKDLDVGCRIQGAAQAGSAIEDPLKVGYWYSSDGKSAKFYASLEGNVPSDQLCKTDDAELKKHDNVICVTAN